MQPKHPTGLPPEKKLNPTQRGTNGENYVEGGYRGPHSLQKIRHMYEQDTVPVATCLVSGKL